MDVVVPTDHPPVGFPGCQCVQVVAPHWVEQVVVQLDVHTTV